MAETHSWSTTQPRAERRSPLDFDLRTYAPQTIAAIVAELGEGGVDPCAVLEASGLDQSQLNNHATKTSYRQLDTVVRNALRLSADPAIALRAGTRMHVTAYGMYGYALLSSATHEQARDFALRYGRVIGPFCDVSVSHNEAAVVLTFEPMHWPNPVDDVHRFAVEFALSAHLTATRDWAGETFAFSRINLAYAAPPYAKVYADMFQCPVVFGQPSNGYWHDLAWADGRVALADPRTHAMAREMCDQLLFETNRVGGFAADIRQVLIENPGRYLNVEQMAEKMGMHPRALRRRLETEETSYRDLVAEVRARLAVEYLRKTQMTNEEIAGRLGYSDAANFRHAFTRWTGKSPSDFRNVARTPA